MKMFFALSFFVFLVVLFAGLYGDTPDATHAWAVHDWNRPKPTAEMNGFATGHYTEFVNAILGKGPYYVQTHSRCFSDIEYCIPQMEGILIGCVAQRLPNQRLAWNSKSQSFDVPAANDFVKPYIRKGFEF